MSLLKLIDSIEPFYSPSSFLSESSSCLSSPIFAPQTLIYPPLLHETEETFFALDYISPYPHTYPSSFELLDTVTHFIQPPPPPSVRSYKRLHNRFSPHDLSVDLLCDRLDGLVIGGGSDRKYKWMAGIEGKNVDRKYKWTAEIKEKKRGKEKHHHHHHYDNEHDHCHRYYNQGKKGRSYKWTAEIEEKGVEGPVKRAYTWQSTIGEEGNENEEKKKEKEKEKKKKKKKKKKEEGRSVEIVEPNDHRTLVLRKAFTKKDAKGKKKELSPPDAASMIQTNFRDCLIGRSQALRAVRELAVAKSKLKEIRSLFHNFSYRRSIAHDMEVRQRFSERIIILLLTVDSLEGADLMVRAAKRSMIDELEAMLDMVDPQHPGKSLAIRRRRGSFDVPDGGLKKEISEGVAQIVRMLDQEENFTTTSEA